MRGNRKVYVVGVSIIALLAGIPLSHDAGIYAAFAGAVVAVDGLFFRANVDVHKTKGEE